HTHMHAQDMHTHICAHVCVVNTLWFSGDVGIDGNISVPALVDRLQHLELELSHLSTGQARTLLSVSLREHGFAAYDHLISNLSAVSSLAAEKCAPVGTS